MSVSIRRKVTKIDEASAEVEKLKAQQETELAPLKKQIATYQQQINMVNQKINMINQKYANQIAQQSAKDIKDEPNKSDVKTEPQQVQSQETSESVKFSFNNQLFEGKNMKHDLLSEAISNVLNDINISYSFQTNEIKRLARKITDLFNANGSDKWEEFRIKIKDYLLKQSKISLSQREINTLLDALKDELQNPIYEIFSQMFDKAIIEDVEENIIIYFDDDTNIDELENEITDAGINIIDENFENNSLTLENVSIEQMKQLKLILNDYFLDEINLDIF